MQTFNISRLVDSFKSSSLSTEGALLILHEKQIEIRTIAWYHYFGDYEIMTEK